MQNNRRYSSFLILYYSGGSGYDTDDGTEHWEPTDERMVGMIFIAILLIPVVVICELLKLTK